MKTSHQFLKFLFLFFIFSVSFCLFHFQVQAVEKIRLSGQLMVYVEENFENKKSQYRYYLYKENKQIIEITGPKVKNLPLLSEIPVEIVGVSHKRNSLELDSFEVKTNLKREQEKRKKLENIRRPVMIIVDLPTKKASAHSNFTSLSTMMNLIADHTSTSSLGQVTVNKDTNNDGVHDIFGPILVPTSYQTGCQYPSWSTSALNLAHNAGTLNKNIYSNYIYVLPTGVGCNWAGLANVGCSYQCNMWISYKPDRMVYVHEFGHNLGLKHAASDYNDTGVIDSAYEYNDYTDPMGNRTKYAPGYNAPHHFQMGWYAQGKPEWIITPANTSEEQEFELAALGNDPRTTFLPQAIRFQHPTRKYGTFQDFYYVSFKGAVGLDTDLESTTKNTVDIHSFYGNGLTRLNKILQPSSVWSSDFARVEFLSYSPSPESKARIKFKIRCETAPTITVQKAATFEAGTSQQFTLSITNNTHTACPETTYQVETTLPNGLTGGPGNQLLLTVRAGETVTSNFSVSANTSLASSIKYRVLYTTVEGNQKTISKESFIVAKQNGVAPLERGLIMSHYNSSTPLSKLPNFEQITPTTISKVSSFSIADSIGQDNFAKVFEGWIEMTARKSFYFYLSSDDGSKLYIDGELVINNDGVHYNSTQTAEVDLLPGFHRIRLEYFDYNYSESLTLLYRSLYDYQPLNIPSEWIYRNLQ